jgi:hypothetical protein
MKLGLLILGLIILAILSLGCESDEILHHCKSAWTCPLPEPRLAEEPPADDGGTLQNDAERSD